MDRIIINGHIIETQVAITSEEQARGLMFQKDPKPLIFVYATPCYNTFWMRDTPSALDILFCLAHKIVHIARGEPMSTALISAPGPSDLIVELPAGHVKALGIKVGDVLKTNLAPSTLKKLFLNGNGFSF
jgi:uncharacterized membrane protein (UPF0127 family)